MANARVKLAKTGHGPHSYSLVVICVVRLLFVLFYVLFVCKCVLPPGDNPIAVNKCIIYLIISYILSCHIFSDSVHFFVVYRYLWRYQIATYIYLHVFLLECLWKDVCFTTPCLFEDMKCQGVNAKLYGKLCRCIPRDSKHACGDAVLQLWIREVVWGADGRAPNSDPPSQLLSYVFFLFFPSPLPSLSCIP
jgi:hypothetical protein